MDGGSKPNPVMDTMIQSTLNRQAAADQQRMNMTGQQTPYGSLSYKADASSPSGYTAVQSYSPEVQGLLDSNISMSRGASDAGNRLLTNASDAMSKPLNLGWSETEARLNDLNRQTLDPLWNQRDEAFRQRMADMGLTEGSAGYQNAARNFGDERSRAYNDMFLRGHETAVNDLTNEYNSPFNALASLRSGSTIAQPVSSFGFTQTPQASIQPVDYMGASQQAYQDSKADSSAALGGMFGLGGAVVGGLGGDILSGAVRNELGRHFRR